MSKITPGRWHRGTGNDSHKVLDDGGRIICDNCGYADGNLIAEAPKLLESCKSLLALTDASSAFDKASVREIVLAVVKRAEYL